MRLIYVYTHTHTYVYTHTHTHVHTHTQGFNLGVFARCGSFITLQHTATHPFNSTEHTMYITHNI